MHYTITALGMSDQVIPLMRQHLLAAGADPADITIKAGRAGLSLPHVSIRTDDLVASEIYHDVLCVLGDVLVSASEESSVFDAVR